MKKNILLLILVVIFDHGFTQTIYESPSGVSFNLSNNWKLKDQESLEKEVKEFKILIGNSSDINYDACFQKSEKDSSISSDIFFQTTLLTTDSIRKEMGKAIELFSNNKILENASKKFFNGKIDIGIINNEIAIDTVNNILIVSFNITIDNKVMYGIWGLCFEANALEALYCIATKEQSLIIKKEFFDIIYSKTKFENKNIILAKNCYNEALKYSQQNIHDKAISLYSEAIDNYPLKSKLSKANAYYNRGIDKVAINDSAGALSDWSEAIKLQPDYANAYNNRGYLKLRMKDYTAAIEDLNKAIELDNYKTVLTTLAFGNRGVAKLYLNQDGCEDLKESIKLGNKGLTDSYNKYCNKK